jgi:hypothetical protein
MGAPPDSIRLQGTGRVFSWKNPFWEMQVWMKNVDSSEKHLQYRPSRPFTLDGVLKKLNEKTLRNGLEHLT